jgi:hypothetical protein
MLPAYAPAALPPASGRTCFFTKPSKASYSHVLPIILDAKTGMPQNHCLPQSGARYPQIPVPYCGNRVFCDTPVSNIHPDFNF